MALDRQRLNVDGRTGQGPAEGGGPLRGALSSGELDNQMIVKRIHPEAGEEQFLVSTPLGDVQRAHTTNR